MKPRLRPLLVLVAALAILLVWRFWPRPDSLAPLVPGVDPAVRSALSAGDMTAAIELADRRGHWASVRIYDQLRDALADDHGGEVAPRRSQVLPGLSVWAEALAQSYHLPEYRRDAAFWRAAGADTTAGLVLRWRDLRTALAAGDLPPDSVKTRLLDHAEAFRAQGDRFGAVRTNYDLANICLKLGQIDEARRRFGEVLDDGRRWGLTAEICDALSSLALFALVADDSAGTDYLVEALDLARGSRLAARAGRALTVAAMHARGEGRFARSMDLLEEAVAICSQLGDAWQGLPYLLYLMRFHAGLDDWRQVAELMPRAEVLLREAERAEADPLMIGREGVRLRELQLRLAIHEGRIEGALAAYLQLVADARRQPFAETAYVYHRQVRALLAVGRPEAALDVLPAAVAHAEDRDQPMLLNLLLASAEASLALDRRQATREALDRFESVQAERESWVGAISADAMALRAVLEYRQGESTASSHLRAGLGSLAEDIAASDASSLAYLELQRNRLLRAALREITGADPETAYGVELFWRRLPAWLGGSEVPSRFVDDPRGLARELGRARRARLTDGRLHLLFAVCGEQVVRWQADATSLRCDTLSLSTAELHDRLDAFLADLARDPGDPAAPVPVALAAQAEELAALLLPPRVHGSDRPRQLLVSCEGALALLPFAVLDLAPGPDYAPLASTIDVVRLRDAGPVATTDGVCRGLVVAAPEVSDHLRRRHPGLTDLAATAGEVDRVRVLLPDITVLSGADASVGRLQATWEDASVLYFACHTVRSPESPYRTFLPLSPGPANGSSLGTPYLDIAGIRTADLQHCRLVVLASCASGAPYVSGRASAPSLGDAFLDAGSGAVLQTLWRVRDDQAAQIPTLVLLHWRVSGEDLVTALAAARRAVMMGPDGQLRHPFGWAAYVLELRDI